MAAQATREAARMLDDAKDYVYSTWDDSQLEAYLRDKGVLTEKTTSTRQELLAKMQDAYAKTADPVWEAWSDSYIVCSMLTVVYVCQTNHESFSANG
jgi:hypothetical protein